MMDSRCLQICSFVILLLVNQTFGAQETQHRQEGQFKPHVGQRYEDIDWNLMKQLRSPDFGNVLISPLSVKLLLVMLYEGSSGDTEKEFQSVLHFPTNKLESRDRYRDIIDSLMKYSTEYTLDLGSRIYMDTSIKAQQRYQGMLKEFYSTDVVNINFSDRSSRDSINYWVSNVTHGHIRDLVSESDLQDANMLLMNALYFKGLWREPFPRNQTDYGVFYTAPRQPIQVLYMYNRGQFYYTESSELDAKILRLPFKGGHVSMFIVLPNSKAGLETLIKDLNSQILRRHVSLMDIHEVQIFLPRFSFDFNAKFGRILQNLGLNSIFQNTASLAAIARGLDGTKQKLMVSNVLQKAGIIIDEEGSTAYAATEFTLANKFGTPEVIFNASNPFMFYIEDENTGSVLFAGKVENPLQEVQPAFKEELQTPSRFFVPSTTEAQVANSNSQNFNGFPPEYFGTPENVLQEDRFYFFDTDLLEAISNSEPYANIFISPLSIKTALTMILEGSANDSEKEIKKALRLPDNKDLIRKQFRELLENFEHKQQGVTLKLGNRIFVSSKLTPIQNYVDILVKYYFSNVTRVNFQNSKQSADIVNDWVDRETHGYISSIADQGTFSPDTSIFLANALYFKGIWLRSFSEQGTQVKHFYLINGERQNTPMMDVVGDFKYDELKQLDAKIIELPYTGNDFSMIILLPNKKDGVHQLARDIRTSINSYVENLNETEVYVTLPRFSIDYSTDLVKYLPSVNIHTISQPNADLSGLTAQLQGKISKMLHKARIEVNEEGTVAAAVTGAVVIPLMGNMKPRFRADHPFLFFIHHKPTKTILFEGRVMTPEKAPHEQQNQQNSQHTQQQRPHQQQPQQRPQHTNTNNVFSSVPQQQPQLQIQPQPQQQPEQILFTSPQNPNSNNFDGQQTFNSNQFVTSNHRQQSQPSSFVTKLSSQSQSPSNVHPIQPQPTETQSYQQQLIQQQLLQQQQQQQQQLLQQQQYYASLNAQSTQNRDTSNLHHPATKPKSPEEIIHFHDEKRPPQQVLPQNLG